MTTIREQFSDPFPRNTFGIITGTFLLSQLPNIPGKIFRLKARSGNNYSIFIGSQTSTGSLTLPFELSGGEDTGWFSANNLNELYQRGASGSQYLAYWAQG